MPTAEEIAKKSLEDAARAKRAADELPNAPSSSSPPIHKGDAFEKRFEALKEEMLAKDMGHRVANNSLEAGIKWVQPTGKNKTDLLDPFTEPSMEILMMLGKRCESAAIATSEDILNITSELMSLGVPRESIVSTVWDMAIYCASNSTSPYMNPKGTVDFKGGTSITRDQVKAVVEKHTTLRKFARYYAPIVWNHMLLNESPPVSWAAQGFSFENRYAAFDTFEYVMNCACAQPKGGLLRQPTDEEVIANKTRYKLATERAGNNRRFANTSAEVTGGKFGCKVKNDWRESKCE